MARSAMIDEIHLSFFLEASLPDRECERIRRTLLAASFKTELRRALRRLMQRRKSLQHVKCIISR